jgi:hypothetical protein
MADAVQVPPAGCTHVVVFNPPQADPEFPGGAWSLRSVAAFLDHGPR